MKINLIIALLIFASCQSKINDEHSLPPEQSLIQADTNKLVEIQIDETEKLPVIKRANIDLPSWELIISAFPKIDSFPITGTIFPLPNIIIGNDSLKMDDDFCYSFPKEITSDFIEKHVESSDSLAIWFNEYGSYMGPSAFFNYGFYPLGAFENNTQKYYIYFISDYHTGRGSYDLSIYLATASNLKWESKHLGDRNYRKYNTHEFTEGEEFVKDRMASEHNLIIELQENKLVITQYYGEHVVGDPYNIFAEGELKKTSELDLH